MTDAELKAKAEQWASGDCSLQQQQDLAKAYLAACRAGWQPIETAPKDGETILLWWKERIRLAHWHTIPKGSQGGPFANWLPDDSGAVPVTVRPTHWTPLPDPPTPEGRG